MKTCQNKMSVFAMPGISVLALLVVSALPASAQQTLTNSEANDPLQTGVSPSVGAMVLRAAVAPGAARQMPLVLRPKVQRTGATAAKTSGKAATTRLASRSATALSITRGLNLLGLGNGFPNFFVFYIPSDVNMAVGDKQVVQWVNASYAVFDKATGNIVAGAFDGNAFWKGFGGPNCDVSAPVGPACRCEADNHGDPVIQWDKLAHRWVATQNVFTLPYLTCVAVSTTPDATGTYYQYAYPQLGGLPDYPKLGIQPDAYYQSQNAFSDTPAGFRYLGAHVCAYERPKMLAGNPKAKQICFQTGPFDDSMLPADLDSANAPPGPQPEVFLGSIDNFDVFSTLGSAVYRYLFHVDFAHPNMSTFAGVGGTMPISVDQFGLACVYGGACITQPSDPNFYIGTLDSLGDRLMYRLAHRNFGTYQSWVVTHSVCALQPSETSCSFSDGVAARWYEFRSSSSSANLTLAQQGTYAPDNNFRWMGSIAQDKAGNIALGYSLSGPSTFPSIFITGREFLDTPGTMRSELSLWNGAGSQAYYSRWGDYTSMVLDAADDCTFWYTNQYYAQTDYFNWSTRLAAFKFNSCR